MLKQKKKLQNYVAIYFCVFFIVFFYLNVNFFSVEQFNLIPINKVG